MEIFLLNVLILMENWKDKKFHIIRMEMFVLNVYYQMEKEFIKKIEFLILY